MLFSVKQGLPVFLYNPTNADGSEYENRNMNFESLTYNALTKYKSKIVEKILRKGYHVSWSDPDIVWFVLSAAGGSLTLFTSFSILIHSGVPPLTGAGSTIPFRRCWP